MQKLVIGWFLASAALVGGCDSSEKKTDDAKADAKSDAGKVDAKDGDVEAGAEEGDTKAAEPAKAVALADISLESVGIDATMQAPEGAKAAEEFGAYTVKAGETFQLEIHAGKADLAVRKKEIEDNTVNKLKSFVTESDTALVYETEVMGKPEFHFVANVDLDGAQYYCEDTKGKGYTQADVEAMHTACTSLQPTE